MYFISSHLTKYYPTNDRRREVYCTVLSCTSCIVSHSRDKESEFGGFSVITTILEPPFLSFSHTLPFFLFRVSCASAFLEEDEQRRQRKRKRKRCVHVHMCACVPGRRAAGPCVDNVTRYLPISQTYHQRRNAPFRSRGSSSRHHHLRYSAWPRGRPYSHIPS